MVGEYAKEMKKSNRTIIKDYYGGVSKAIKEHALTYSGWLTFIKKLSEEEISLLFDDAKRDSKLQKEYELWMGKKK